MGPRKVYVTLLTKNSYLPAALVLNESLKRVGSKYPLVIMSTPSLPTEAKEALTRQRMETTTRIVLLDCDMIVMRNMDELFDIDLPDGWIAAAHVCACNPMKFAHYPADWIPENCAYTPLEHPTALTQPTQIQPDSPRAYGLLNSGMVVLQPSAEVMAGLTEFLSTSPLVSTFRFPDQDLLATFYEGRWKPLPWCFNALKTLRKLHQPLWRDGEIRCLHYILAVKPWQTKVVDEWEKEMHQWWWDRLSQEGDEETLRLARENAAQ
ncbi:nucleotide-diphospho-sugar transferase [Thelephora terrestris]|uniref:Nucleotide-diphospho-sugar transferase n=1 Tax=Thelephora terrestris TaxID=56493 RepID=A0A9P6HHH5_9AGAM|nr:nucleotide-diphospho-sugar transferase [Thelephora terrestris]